MELQQLELIQDMIQIVCCPILKEFRILGHVVVLAFVRHDVVHDKKIGIVAYILIPDQCLLLNCTFS